VKIQILGTRGIPAQHGGFETFAEQLSLYLQSRGWQVTVYCQEEGGWGIYEDTWCGIHCVHIPIAMSGSKGTILFDWKATLLAVKKRSPVLTLGYNTAIFCLLYRLKGVPNVINMDGVEWKRKKWSKGQRAWLCLNEKIGAWLGDHLIADHPEIKKNISCFTPSSKITVVPYTADLILNANKDYLTEFNLIPSKYALVIARPEQENSILEIVIAYSQVKRGIPLVILGDYRYNYNSYHKMVLDSAGDEVKFIGANYNKKVVQALRFFARFYIHGHTVGGTNPSLVEALGASSPTLAHDNKFNRWVAGKGGCYFTTIDQCSEKITTLLQDDNLISKMKQNCTEQFKKHFIKSKILQKYEVTLLETLKL
jgi:glycosyltransferase involved in cell wall biosynthesis